VDGWGASPSPQALKGEGKPEDTGTNTKRFGGGESFSEKKRRRISNAPEGGKRVEGRVERGVSKKSNWGRGSGNSWDSLDQKVQSHFHAAVSSWTLGVRHKRRKGRSRRKIRLAKKGRTRKRGDESHPSKRRGALCVISIATEKRGGGERIRWTR